MRNECHPPVRPVPSDQGVASAFIIGLAVQSLKYIFDSAIGLRTVMVGLVRPRGGGVGGEGGGSGERGGGVGVGAGNGMGGGKGVGVGGVK